MFGPVMLNKLDDAVTAKARDAGFMPEWMEDRPYSVFAIEILDSVGIADFMEGKLKDGEMRQWDWHGYMQARFKKYFPVKNLFGKEYDRLTDKIVTNLDWQQ